MKHILLIEDDRDIVELVRYNLEREGFQIASAADGASGLAQLRKSPPDILLLDLMLEISDYVLETVEKVALRKGLRLRSLSCSKVNKTN